MSILLFTEDYFSQILGGNSQISEERTNANINKKGCKGDCR